MRVHLDLVLGARVVEARLHLDLEAHVTAHDDHAPDQPVPVHALLHLALDRHEVLHLPHPLVGEEARDQDVRVREVELLGLPGSVGRMDRVVAALVLVEDRPKTLGESKWGQQYQSIVPLVPTSATVWRSPTRPCSAIGR